MDPNLTSLKQERKEKSFNFSDNVSFQGGAYVTQLPFGGVQVTVLISLVLLNNCYITACQRLLLLLASS